MCVEHGSILVVDDDETNREVLSLRLEGAGYTVTLATNGREALALAEKVPCDLVLLDVMMPEINGLEVLRTLRQTRPIAELPIVMATARDRSEDIVLALKEGASDYVTKPYDFPVLLARVQTQLALRRAIAQIGYLREEIQSTYDFTDVIGHSETLREILEKVKRVAPTDATVLITGETGTGKELVARAIHNLSPRQSQPLVKVNCGAIAPGLVESELFGHEKGAFTGAQERRIGRFELADGGTIFLDEIAELPLDNQVKLLRVLQEQEFERVGSSRSQKINVRVIAATNRNLADSVKDRTFREDLFYRLHVVPLKMPALREHREDIVPLVDHFLARFGRKLGKRFTGVSPEMMRQLQAYSWPGNVRELQNVIERATILSEGPLLGMEDPLQSPLHDDRPIPAGITLEEVERAHILHVLASAGGVIEGPEGAAAQLGLPPSTLRSRMAKLGISRSPNE
jgi:formate hydrogenlyase transcriptional activator